MSCIASALMLIYSPESNRYKIRSMQGLDSVIVATLNDHQVQRAHYRVTTTPVDSVYARKTYRVLGIEPLEFVFIDADIDRPDWLALDGCLYCDVDGDCSVRRACV